MAGLLTALAGLASLGSLICLIIVIVKMCKNDMVVLGIVSIICGLIAFVVGWQNAGKWGIKNIMIIWTICIVVGIGMNVAAIGMAAAAGGAGLEGAGGLGAPGL